MWEKTVAYCWQAGEKALTRSAHREAVAYYEQALSALQHLPETRATHEQAIDLRLALHTPLIALGRYRTLLDHLREAATLAEIDGERSRLGRVFARLCVLQRVGGANYPAAIETGHRAFVLATELKDRRLEARSALCLAQAYWAIGDFVRATDLLRRSLEATAGQLDLAVTAAICYAWLAFALSALGQFVEGITHGEAAVRLPEASGRVFPRIEAQATLGHLYLNQGDLQGATGLLEKTVALARTWDIMDFGLLAVSDLGLAYALAGRLPH